jgi:DNA primase
VRVIELPAGEDPDSLIRGQGAAAFVSRVEAARDYFDYRIDTATREPSFATPHGQTDFAKGMAATALLISDKLLRENVAAKVATRLGMMPASFWRLLPKTGEKAAAHEMKPGFLNPTALKEPLNVLALLAVGDPEIRRWIFAQPWSGRLMETEGAELLVRVLDSEVSLEEPASLSAFEAGLDDSSRTLLGALLRERLPEDRLAAARDCWYAMEKKELLHRREVLLARMREPEVSAGEITEIQKQILDLQKHLTDISRPLSQPGPE